MTEIFLDTANLNEIQEILQWGIITGITTNQKIFEKEKGCNFEEQAAKILKLAESRPVSLEGPNRYDDLIETAKKYNKWGKNVVVKVPMLGNGDGIRAVKVLKELGIKTNVTACMTTNQTFLAIAAGATYVSLFYNRMKDMVHFEPAAQTYSLETIAQTMEMISDGGYKTKLIVGSIRKPSDIEDILTAEPHIITIPTKILKQMPFNEMTEKSLAEFEKAWEEFCKAEPKK
jgi:transaldolase